jgi:hypothetical protein
VVLKRKQDSPIGGKIAYFFFSVFNQVWEAGMKEDVEQLLKEHEDYEIWVRFLFDFCLIFESSFWGKIFGV